MTNKPSFLPDAFQGKENIYSNLSMLLSVFCNYIYTSLSFIVFGTVPFVKYSVGILLL